MSSYFTWWRRPRNQNPDSADNSSDRDGTWQFDGRPCCRNCHFLGLRKFGHNFLDSFTPNSWSAEERQSLRIDHNKGPYGIDAIEVNCQQGFLATQHVSLEEDPSLNSIRERLNEIRRACSFIEFQPGMTFEAAVNSLQERRSRRRFHIGLLVGIATLIAAICGLAVSICGLNSCAELLESAIGYVTGW
ncbi:MAG: hypothetical protein F4Y46_08585 [Chloroflexi bacterium]|nr:hypothetical protein [Chloroflexota bacterium]